MAEDSESPMMFRKKQFDEQPVATGGTTNLPGAIDTTGVSKAVALETDTISENPIVSGSVNRSQASSSDSRNCEPYRILFLIDRFAGPISGGAEVILLNIVRLLPKDRFRCSVVTFGIEPGLDLAEQFPCPVHLIPLRRTYDWNGFKAAIKLGRMIRSEKIDIVHSFFETSDLWGGVIAKLSGCPLLVSSRRDMGILRKPKHEIAYRFIGHWQDLILTVSESVRNFCIQRDGLDPQKVVTLYNGVAPERLVSSEADRNLLRKSLGLEHSSPLIVSVANIRPIKGIDVLIRAAVPVCREYPQAGFVIVGHPSDEEHFQEVQALARSLGVERNIHFVGGHREISPFLQMSQVFCMLSRSEGFSNALIEAMAAGLPCVTTRVGGNSEAFEDGKSGFLVENEDAEAAAQRILLLLRNPALARRMGELARQVVAERFQLDVMMQKLTSLYEGLLNRRKR